MIRPAKPSDINAIYELGLVALNDDPIEELVISPDRVMAAAKETVSSPQHFSWVAEVDGEVRGAVIAMSCDMTFYERKQASVIMFYCRSAPGEGIKLLRELMSWYQSRSVLKMLEFTLEIGADPRIGKLLRRLGLFTALPIYIHLK